MARKFSFKGKSVEELKAMPLEEFIKIIPSKVRRTMRRMGLQIKSTLKKFREAKKKGKPMRTHNRQMVVLPEMLDSHIFVHDGKNFVDLLIVPQMLGRRLGEYAITTKLVKHSGPGIGATRGSKSVELK